jgi:DNA-binding MarR family transcriptional regulator
MQPAQEIPLPGLFSITQDAVERELFSVLADAGYHELRPTHGCVFGTIGPEGDRLTSLAERAGMTKQAVGEVVSELEKLGYAERVPDPSDGRAKIIRLTDRGQDSYKLAYSVMAEIQRRWEERYGAERVRAMLELMRDIVEDENAAREGAPRPAAAA